MVKKIFEIVGYISTCLVSVWTLVQIYKSIFTKKEKLGYTYRKIDILNYENEFFTKKYADDVISVFPMLKYTYKDGTTKDVDLNLKTHVVAYQYVFKNIGSVKIEGKQFYQTEKLGLKSRNILFATVNKETQKYINAKLIIDNEKLEIDFEVLDPKDEISITVLTQNYLLDMDILGKTDNIKKIEPIDFITLREKGLYSVSFFYGELLIFKAILNILKNSFIFWFFMLIISMYVFCYSVGGFLRGMNV